MRILDDMEKIKELDSMGMLDVEEKFHEQLLKAKEIGQSAEIKNIKTAADKLKGIAITGMGGSGFAGDFIKNLIIHKIDVPVEIVKGYELPKFVSGGWLVIATSYSGNTEETVSSASQAILRGCDMVGISSGGIIEDIAKKNNKDHIKLPPGFQPRGASGYLFFSTYILLNKIGAINLDILEVDEALNLIEEKAGIFNRYSKIEDNPAKKLALSLYGRLPVIYGINGYLSSVAYRWKCQVNENAKCPAFWAEFPELNHNETVGWDNLSELTEKMILIVLRDSSYGKKIQARIDTTIQLINKSFADVLEVKAEGSSMLSRALYTMYLGDIASVYLALLYGVDPTPVKMIEALKAELAKIDT